MDERGSVPRQEAPGASDARDHAIRTMANGDTPSTDLEGTTEVEQQLTELVDAHEQIAWDHVPTVSVSEAAAWTQRLQEARQEAAQKQRLVADGGTSRRQFMGAAAALGLLPGATQATSRDEDEDSYEPTGDFTAESHFHTDYFEPGTSSFLIRSFAPEAGSDIAIDLVYTPFEAEFGLDEETAREIKETAEDVADVHEERSIEPGEATFLASGPEAVQEEPGITVIGYGDGDPNYDLVIELGADWGMYSLTFKPEEVEPFVKELEAALNAVSANEQ